jgi:hypothetical protein
MQQRGVTTVRVDFEDPAALRQACEGAACIVSALSGLRETIVDAQRRLLIAAVGARVPRFIPSDFSIDFTQLSPGTNRNLDLRREFAERLAQAPIAATSILNGMFSELLVGKAPVVLRPLRRVLYWGDADQRLDFTTMDDTAAFTAAAALDAKTPRFLRVAGDQQAARGLVRIASEVTGRDFALLRGGSLARLDRVTKLLRTVYPAKNQVFSPWQGLQYLRDMFSGEGKLEPLANDRYAGMRWTPISEVLARASARPLPVPAASGLPAAAMSSPPLPAHPSTARSLQR